MPIADEFAWQDPWPEPFTLQDAYAERPPVKFIVDGIIRENSLNMLFGAPGGMKTLLALDLCLHIAGGLDWLPPAPWMDCGAALRVTQAPVMYIDLDNGRDDMHERIEALSRHLQLEADIPFFYYSFPDGGLDAGDKKSMGNLAKRITARGVRLAVIDNLGIVKGRADENSDEMVPVMNNFRAVIEETGSAIKLIHHQRKESGTKGRAGDTIRGHSSIEAALNLALAVNREEYSDTISIRQAKARGGQVLPFSASFTYKHKPGTNVLDTAAFYGLTTEDTSSDSAIDKMIISALIEVRPEKLNQVKLSKAVRELMPGIGDTRVRNRIRRLAGMREIKSEPGAKHNEELYYVI